MAVSIYPTQIKRTTVAALMVLFAVLSGCAQDCECECEKEENKPDTPPESLLQSALPAHLSETSSGGIVLTEVKKTDGQLQPDGLNYVMEYQANFSAAACMFHKTYMYNDYEANSQIQLALFKPSSHRAACDRFKGKTGNWPSPAGMAIGKDFQAQIAGKAVFTKKEKGWSFEGATTEYGTMWKK